MEGTIASDDDQTEDETGEAVTPPLVPSVSVNGQTVFGSLSISVNLSRSSEFEKISRTVSRRWTSNSIRFVVFSCLKFPGIRMNVNFTPPPISAVAFDSLNTYPNV